MTRFKYYTIYRCRNCGERIRVHGKLASKLIFPPGLRMCCDRPRLLREREVQISEYKTKQPVALEEEDTHPEPGKQKSLTDFSKKK